MVIIPARKSRLIKEKQPFAPVDTARKIYGSTLNMCIKMPKRYTYLVLKETIELAGKVMDYTKMANSVFPTNQHEAQIRRDYWIVARSSLQALSSRIDRFIEMPDALSYKFEDTGKVVHVTINELNELADLIISEMSLITNQLESEEKRFKDLK